MTIWPSALQKTFIFIRKKHFSCNWALLLKLHLATFFHWKKAFQHLRPSILFICLVALNTELVFLEALKKWFCAFKLQNDLFCKKAQKHEYLSSALQKTFHFIRKKHFSCNAHAQCNICFRFFPLTGQFQVCLKDLKLAYGYGLL